MTVVTTTQNKIKNKREGGARDRESGGEGERGDRNLRVGSREILPD